MGRKRQRNQVRKRGVFPRFVLSAKGGYETVWRYLGRRPGLGGGWEITVFKRSQTEYAWQARKDDFDFTELLADDFGLRSYQGALTGPTGETEQDALWLAKYSIDKVESFLKLARADRHIEAGGRSKALKVLEGRARYAVEKERRRPITRAYITREWEQFREDYGHTGFYRYIEELPLKERIAIFDDIVEYTKRASWWEILTPAEQRRRGGGQFRNPRKRPLKNPQGRARAIMRSFMRL